MKFLPTINLALSLSVYFILIATIYNGYRAYSKIGGQIGRALGIFGIAFFSYFIGHTGSLALRLFNDFGLSLPHFEVLTTLYWEFSFMSLGSALSMYGFYLLTEKL
ncbi:MAG: hypothetical protein SVV03_06615 [Candidatus Nanohaloarchaea archaeon]|nr:hypothetical protein [Candidatus Nanohaloarchaea archaeon]